MKHTLLTALVVLLTTCSLCAQISDAEYIRQHYTKREVLIPMRDGVQLFTSIYTPKDQSRTYPILLKRTPYSCAPYGDTSYTKGFQNMNLARAGYIFVTQDVRGRYMSEGEFVDVRPFRPDIPRAPRPPAKPQKKGGDDAGMQARQPIDEATDTYDTAEWLTKNMAASNGRIGVYGISYPGFYATMAILAEHPAIKAVSPQAPVTDWFIGDDFHHNGAFMVMDGFAFYSGFGKPRPKPTSEPQKGFSDWGTPDNYDFYLRVGALRNLNDRYLKGSIPFWNELMQHPDYDAWWQARNPRPHLRNVRPAVMTVGGLFDAEDCFGAWQVYKAIENQNDSRVSNRVVMGPWTHGGWARNPGDRLGRVQFGQATSPYYAAEIEFKFFEYYLRDQGSVAQLADVTVFETGSNRWTSYPAWPPAGVQTTKYFFQNDGQLGTNPIGPQKHARSNMSADTYRSDPAHPVPYTEDVHLRRTNEYMCDDQRFAARRPDVLTYQTPTLSEPLTVTGPVVADLLVSLQAQGATTGLLDADFVVKLIDVYPDTLSTVEKGLPMGGYQMLVRGEIFRGRYRNSFERPEGFRAGEVYPVKFELPDIAHTFLPGHRLMVQVQSSWFPLADRNPQQYVNIYECTDADFIPLDITVWHNVAHPSGVILPVLKK
jgi:uncharacterized protein